MAQDQREDEALMMAYQQGETAAFNTLLERHRRPVFNFLLRQVGNAATAEDLLQEVFLRIVRSSAGYKRQAKFTTWLYTIARNLCVDNARRGKHRQAASLQQPLGNSPENRTLGDITADSAPDAERLVSNRRLQERILTAIGRLNDEQREVFLMRETLNLPFKEIAEIVQCPENTVKSRMRYALEQLRRDLEEFRETAQTVH